VFSYSNLAKRYSNVQLIRTVNNHITSPSPISHNNTINGDFLKICNNDE